MLKTFSVLVVLLAVGCSSGDSASPVEVVTALDAAPATTASTGGAAGPTTGGWTGSGGELGTGGTGGTGGSSSTSTDAASTGGTDGEVIADAGVTADLATATDLPPVELVDAAPHEVGLPRPPANCNMMSNFGVKVAEVQIAEALPTPTGGVFPGGHRFLIAQAIYTGPGGATGPTGKTRQHHIFTTKLSGVLRIDQVDATNSGANVHGQLRGDASGTTSLLLFETCPTPKPIGTVGYSVDGLKVLIIDPATKVVQTYGPQ